ncbi:MAG: tRNA (adenosine(37)-N6)-threonylcarbamoyltransferase complex dimerization subunit type 1 TsaB [Dehalococcoidia bacterium]
MELSIDTSTDVAGIALSEQGVVIALSSWNTAHNHTVELLPNILNLLERGNCRIQDIGYIIVAIGPGSFNGLRVGLSTAKGLSFALNAPVKGVSTLEAIANVSADTSLPICPIIPMGRNEIATATFRIGENGLTTVIPEHVTTVSDLCSGITEKTFFPGEMTPAQKEELKSRLGELALIIPDENIPERVGCLARLGWCKIDRGHIDNRSALQPLYLKKPSITRPKRRRHDALSNMRARTE